MSAHAPAPTVPRPDSVGRRGPTFGRVVASEWTKIGSLRSTYWIAGVTIALSWAMAYLSANASSGDPGFQPEASLADGLALSQLAMCVLGVLVGTGELSTGAFRATFVAVPRRVPVLAARALVTAGVGAVIAALALVATVLGILPAAASRGMGVDLTAENTPQALVGSFLLLVGMALLGLGAGALLRHTALATTAVLALVFVVPVALSLASDLATDPLDLPVETEVATLDPVSTALAFLPGDAAYRMTTTAGGDGPDGAPDLGPWGGGAVFAAWILVPLVAAGVRLRTRDVT